MRIIQFQPSACLEWRAYRDGQAPGWVALCDALGRRATGETWGQLCATIFETQQTLLTDLFAEGELAAFLTSNDLNTRIDLPPVLPVGGVTFDIPTVVTPMPNNLSRL